MHHFPVDRLIFLACLAISVRPTMEEACPQHNGADPSGANDRIKSFEGQKAYETQDTDYDYEIRVCKENNNQVQAVIQIQRKNGQHHWTIGTFEGAQLQGGNDWLMVTYFHGDKYNTHCGSVERKAVLMITCDPDASRRTVKVLEEYKTNKTFSKDEPCYYLFELNHKAACSVKPRHISPGSVLLIIFLIVGSVYLFLGFLYQRFVVGAKGLEQIPNYNLWRGCGSLQAVEVMLRNLCHAMAHSYRLASEMKVDDGCNYFCRCNEAQTTRYKTMDEALADDEERDDTLLPM